MNGPVRVRIVEDHEDLQTLLALMLNRAHVEPVITELGTFYDLFDSQAWEGINVAIVDIHLGTDITGWDVLAYLKDNHPHIKRVVWTASTSLNSLTEEERSLIDEYLHKPCDPKDILQAIGVQA